MARQGVLLKVIRDNHLTLWEPSFGVDNLVLVWKFSVFRNLD
jgi:hypothetical protein